MSMSRKGPHFLRLVFPDLRLHAAWQPASGTSESQAVLTIHDTVPSDTLHSLLASVRFHAGGIQRIKSIHRQQDARIVGGVPGGERYYHLCRYGSVCRSGREGNRRTVQEVLKLLESPTGVPQVDEPQVTVRFVVTFPGVFQVLVNSLAAFLPISAHNLHIRIILVCAGANRSFSDIQAAFTEAVEMYARRWSSIPLARRNIKKKDPKILPMMRLEASTAEGIEVVGTITALPGKKGRMFEADLQGKGSWKGRGKKQTRPLSKVYPAVYADGVKVS
ncbi:hypothetical protein QFC20_004023 [Naganishia adeliensis]|uniref:Uncharacterized protein n=1 Tax=Naganishia adeliensis TaxID=92952 RepID=A0ACC2W6F7_9TREE|nr:hypothetical protein QFC20_004023 [Naganishia adeliensis]